MKTFLSLLVVCLMLFSVTAFGQVYGVGLNMDVKEVPHGSIQLNLKADSAAWAGQPEIDLASGWDDGGFFTQQVVAGRAKLLWTQDTLFVFATLWSDDSLMQAATEGWNGTHFLVSVDGPHAGGPKDNSWAGWPTNAPDKGPTTYKIWKNGPTANWGSTQYAHGIVAFDTTWSDSTGGNPYYPTFHFTTELAIYVPQITSGAQIGFNIGGGVATATTMRQFPSSPTKGWYSWQYVNYPGGDVMYDPGSFVTLNMVTGKPYGKGVGVDVPAVNHGVVKLNSDADSLAWKNATAIDIATKWDGAWSGNPYSTLNKSVAKLLWTTDTLFVDAVIQDYQPFFWGPWVAKDTAFNHGEGDQILITIDASHAGDGQMDGSWQGWPSNVPGHVGPFTWKVWAGGPTVNYDSVKTYQAINDSHFVAFSNTLNNIDYIWHFKGAFRLNEVKAGAKIGFNIGGCQGDSVAGGGVAWYSWQYVNYPGGDVMHDGGALGTLNLVGTVTGVAPGQALPTAFALEQNYPNPFNPSTQITYSLPRAANVTLSVYNLLGQRVAVLANGVQTAGVHESRWNAVGMSTGLYFYQLQADGKVVATKKMMLLK